MKINNQEGAGKVKLMNFAIVVAVMFCLTSCISYTGSKLTTAETLSPIHTVQKKVYIEQLTMSPSASVWIRNDKQRKAGVKIGPESVSEEKDMFGNTLPQDKIVNLYRANNEDFHAIVRYVTSRHPEIFTEDKGGAIPVKLHIHGKNAPYVGETIFDEIFNRLIFLGIFPFGLFAEQYINIDVDILNDPLGKETLTCRLYVTHKSGICVSPFVWLGASLADIVHFDAGFLGHSKNDIWQNYFLTPEFADIAANAVYKTLNQ